MENSNIVLNGVIKGLKLGSKILECFKKDNKDKKERFELANHKIRHIYEKSSDYELEAKTKFGTSSNKSNIYDSFVIKTHPKNNQYKLMVLTEGKGFLSFGDKQVRVSDFVALNIEDWFLKLTESDLDSFYADSLNKSLSKCISFVDVVLRDEKENASKAIMALIGPEYTYVCNVGDLRCYIDDGYNFVQYNEEDSYLWDCYREGFFADKEEFRFSKKKELGVGMIGLNKDSFASSYIIRTDMYDRLFLFSRGVIDCLSEGKMYDINLSSSSSRGVVDAIISHSTNGHKEYMSYYNGDSSSDITPVIHGEKDATACCYVKVKK